MRMILLPTVLGGTALEYQGTCGTNGCEVTHTFSITGWSSGKKVLLTVAQTGDLDSVSEYTTLYASGSKVADCKSSTSSWATPSQCADVDVTRYVSSSGSLALRLDANSEVNYNDGPLNTHLGTKFSLKITGTAAGDIGKRSGYCIPCADPDAAGPFCEYTRAKTCNSQGTPLYDGKCKDCAAGFAGPNCEYSNGGT